MTTAHEKECPGVNTFKSGQLKLCGVTPNIFSFCSPFVCSFHQSKMAQPNCTWAHCQNDTIANANGIFARLLKCCFARHCQDSNKKQCLRSMICIHVVCWQGDQISHASLQFCIGNIKLMKLKKKTEIPISWSRKQCSSKHFCCTLIDKLDNIEWNDSDKSFFAKSLLSCAFLNDEILDWFISLDPPTAASTKHSHSFNENVKCSCFVWCRHFQWFAQIDVGELLKSIWANCWNCCCGILCTKCVDSHEFQQICWNNSVICLNKFCVCFLIMCASHTFPGCCSVVSVVPWANC